MEENNIDIVQVGKELYKTRCYIKSELVKEEENKVIDGMTYQVYSFTQFKAVKLRSKNSNIYFKAASFLLFFNSTYTGEVTEPREAIVYTAVDSYFLISLKDKYIDIYEEGEDVVLELIDIDVIVTSVAAGKITEIENTYPTITFKTDCDGIGNIIITYYMRIALGYPEQSILSICTNNDNFTQMHLETMKVLTDNAEDIASILALSKDDRLLYVTEGSIVCIRNIIGHTTCQILDITLDKIEWRTSKLTLIELLERPHMCMPIPDYVFYNGKLFDSNFELLEDTLTDYNKVVDLMTICIDTHSILTTRDEYAIVMNNKAIICELMKQLELSKYYKANMLLSFNGKLYITTEILDNAKEVLEWIKIYEENRENIVEE